MRGALAGGVRRVRGHSAAQRLSVAKRDSLMRPSRVDIDAFEARGRWRRQGMEAGGGDFLEHSVTRRVCLHGFLFRSGSNACKPHAGETATPVVSTPLASFIAAAASSSATYLITYNKYANATESCSSCGAQCVRRGGSIESMVGRAVCCGVLLPRLRSIDCRNAFFAPARVRVCIYTMSPPSRFPIVQ